CARDGSNYEAWFAYW
nr:immunoglobulin heavy chain junction region [Mus musculus]